MAQWYGNVPVCWNAKENLPPGATIPEFQPVASDVDVWEIESVFVHVTVVPTATSRASGVKALFPRDSAPTGIETAQPRRPAPALAPALASVSGWDLAKSSLRTRPQASQRL